MVHGTGLNHVLTASLRINSVEIFASTSMQCVKNLSTGPLVLLK